MYFYNPLQPVTTLFNNILQISYIFYFCNVCYTVFLYLKYNEKSVFNYLLYDAWLGSSIKCMFEREHVCVCVLVCVCVCVNI